VVLYDQWLLTSVVSTRKLQLVCEIELTCKAGKTTWTEIWGALIAAIDCFTAALATHFGCRILAEVFPDTLDSELLRESSKFSPKSIGMGISSGCAADREGAGFLPAFDILWLDCFALSDPCLNFCQTMFSAAEDIMITK
jgi:hypothetical protein